MLLWILKLQQHNDFKTQGQRYTLLLTKHTHHGCLAVSGVRLARPLPLPVVNSLLFFLMNPPLMMPYWVIMSLFLVGHLLVNPVFFCWGIGLTSWRTRVIVGTDGDTAFFPRLQRMRVMKSYIILCSVQYKVWDSVIHHMLEFYAEDASVLLPII